MSVSGAQPTITISAKRRRESAETAGAGKSKQARIEPPMKALFTGNSNLISNKSAKLKELSAFCIRTLNKLSNPETYNPPINIHIELFQSINQALALCNELEAMLRNSRKAEEFQAQITLIKKNSNQMIGALLNVLTTLDRSAEFALELKAKGPQRLYNLYLELTEQKSPVLAPTLDSGKESKEDGSKVTFLDEEHDDKCKLFIEEEIAALTNLSDELIKLLEEHDADMKAFDRAKKPSEQKQDVHPYLFVCIIKRIGEIFEVWKGIKETVLYLPENGDYVKMMNQFKTCSNVVETDRVKLLEYLYKNHPNLLDNLKRNPATASEYWEFPTQVVEEPPEALTSLGLN